jgi:hypothetical protein
MLLGLPYFPLKKSRTPDLSRSMRIIALRDPSGNTKERIARNCLEDQSCVFGTFLTIEKNLHFIESLALREFMYARVDSQRLTPS